MCPIKCLPLVLIFLLAIAVRITPALCVQWVSNDSVEYLDIARHLADGQGFTLSVKAYHFLDTPAVHYGGYDRPLLFPALVALTWVIWPHPLAPQILNVLLAACAAAVAMSLMRAVYSRRAAMAAGVLIALSPALVRSSLYPWTEALALVLALATVRVAIGQAWRWQALALGAIIGAAFLARPTTLWVSVMAVAWLLIRDRNWRPMAFALIGLAPFLAIWIGTNVVNDAPPFTTPQGYIYRSGHFQDGMYWYPPRIAESALDLLRERSGEVAIQIFRNSRSYLQSLFGMEWLGLLGPGLFIVLWANVRRRKLTPRLLIALLGIVGLVFICLTWPTKDVDRFLQMPYAFLLLAIVGETDLALRDACSRLPQRSTALKAAALAILAISAVAYLRPIASLTREAWTRRVDGPWAMMGIFSSNWRNDDALEFHRWILDNTQPTAIFAATNPWAINHHTRRTAVLLPQRMNFATLRQFLSAHGVTHVVLNAAHPPPQMRAEPDYGPWLDKLTPVSEAVCDYWIYEVKP